MSNVTNEEMIDYLMNKLHLEVNDQTMLNAIKSEYKEMDEEIIHQHYIIYKDK